MGAIPPPPTRRRSTDEANRGAPRDLPIRMRRVEARVAAEVTIVTTPIRTKVVGSIVIAGAQFCPASILHAGPPQALINIPRGTVSP